MVEQKPHSHNCPLCCQCSSDNNQNTNEDPEEVCPSCGLQLKFAKKLFTTTGHVRAWSCMSYVWLLYLNKQFWNIRYQFFLIYQNEILTGRLPESLDGKGPSPTEMPLGVLESHVIQNADPLMRKLLEVWITDLEQEPHDRIVSQPLFFFKFAILEEQKKQIQIVLNLNCRNL